MRTILLASIAAVAVTSAASAQATEQSFHLGLGYTALDGEGATLGAITARGGVDFSRYWGVEADLHVGVVDESVDAGPPVGEVDISADFGAAAFVVGRLPVGEDSMSNLFVRAGYGTITVEGSAMGVTVAEDVDGFALGVGGEFYFGGPNGVRLDYTRFEGDDEALDSYGIAYIRRF
ncbi:MAG: outer membrane beta-barrel protein [Oceanicaulis sp.]